MTTTDWIDGSIKPEIDGPYQRQYNNPREIRYCFFGGFWGYGFSTVDDASTGRYFKSHNQSLPWRGLKEKP